MRIAIIRHVPFEGAGKINDWCRERNHSVREILLYENEPLPDVSLCDGIVVMGGPMSTGDTEKFPFLEEEKKFLGEAVSGKKPILGICLGAQLLSEVLGGSVGRGPAKEIGWFPVRPVAENGYFPGEITVLHWHGDMFSIPPDAERLLESDLCPNQAFIKDSLYLGLQFHLEMTPEGAEAIIEASAEELSEPGPGIQNPQQIRSGPFGSTTATLYRLLDTWTAKA